MSRALTEDQAATLRELVAIDKPRACLEAMRALVRAQDVQSFVDAQLGRFTQIEGDFNGGTITKDDRYAESQKLRVALLAKIDELTGPAAVGVAPARPAGVAPRRVAAPVAAAGAANAGGPPTLVVRPRRRWPRFTALTVAGIVIIVLGFSAIALGLGRYDGSLAPWPVPTVGVDAAAVVAAVDASSPADPDTPCPDGMVFVPAGEVAMGAVQGDPADEHDEPNDDEFRKPETWVKKLSAYCIDRTEVTVAKYSECVKAGTCEAAPIRAAWKDQWGHDVPRKDVQFWSRFCNGDRADRQDHPVNCVEWKHASTYCEQWRGATLPTEAQWEHVARATRGARYPWGDGPRPESTPYHKLLNAGGTEFRALDGKYSKWPVMYEADDGHAATAPVGAFPDGDAILRPGDERSRVHDLEGNVMEWMQDWYAIDYVDGVDDPVNRVEGEKRSVRGAGWNSSAPSMVRAADRVGRHPTRRLPGVGFRCARGAR